MREVTPRCADYPSVEGPRRRGAEMEDQRLSLSTACASRLVNTIQIRAPVLSTMSAPRACTRMIKVLGESL